MEDMCGVVLSLLEIFRLSQKYMLGNFGETDRKLTKTQFFIIMAIWKKKNMSMSQVASAISASKEQTTRAMIPLEEEGYVRRYHDEKNRRIVRVEMTEKGYEVLDRVRNHMISNLGKRLELLTEEEQEWFSDAADRMLELMLKIDGAV